MWIITLLIFENILINQAQSEVLGNPSSILNVGDVESSGLEFEFAGVLVNSNDFSWNMNANLSTVNTKITYLGGLDELPQQIFGQSGRGAVFRNYVGGEIGEMWGLETTGPVEMAYLADGTRHPNNQSGESYVVDQMVTVSLTEHVPLKMVEIWLKLDKILQTFTGVCHKT